MKRHAPATTRNRDPIAAVLAEELPETGLVLEVASGSGEHAVHFARTFSALSWQPSDFDPAALASIAAWRDETGLSNLQPPLSLDVTASSWPPDYADAVVCCNMIHIAPIAAAEGLVAGAARLLPPGAPLVLYGPYLERDVETAASNRAFDADLRGRSPDWGLRDVEFIDQLAEMKGFIRTRRVAMPANNLALVYRRQT